MIEDDDQPMKDRQGRDLPEGEIIGQEFVAEPDVIDRAQIQTLWQKTLGGNAKLMGTKQEWAFLLLLLRSRPDSERLQ